jgi:hypothetical protein
MALCTENRRIGAKSAKLLAMASHSENISHTTHFTVAISLAMWQSVGTAQNFLAC